VSNECTNFAITPRDGTYTQPVYPGYSDNNAKQVYLERQQLDGKWIPVANLERDQPYYTTQTGHYRAFVDRCRDNIVEFDLSVPSPKLKNYSTLAYYCGKAAETSPNTAGTILIEAYDGTPPYSYHLYEMDASKPNKLGTLVSSYTNKPLGEQVAFSNLGVKAYIVKIEDACQQYFFYEDVMRPLKDVARAFVKKAGGGHRPHLRGAEDDNLDGPPRHFEAISTSGNVVYGVAKDYKTLYDKVMK